jgi:hypothetical protein
MAVDLGVVADIFRYLTRARHVARYCCPTATSDGVSIPR